MEEAALDELYEELRNPASWHWKVDERTGWFKRSQQYEVQHVLEVLKRLDQEDPAAAQRLRVYLRALYASFKDAGEQDAVHALESILGVKNQERLQWLEKAGYPIYPYQVQRMFAQCTSDRVQAVMRVKDLLIKNWWLTERLTEYLDLDHHDLFTYWLPAAAHLITDSDDLQDTAWLLCKNLPWLRYPRVTEILLDARSFDEFKRELSAIEQRMLADKDSWTAQGLRRKGCLVCHVTNGVGHNMGRNDENAPLANIRRDITARPSFSLSASVIGPGVPSSLLTQKHAIGGAIGVILDYGYIYQAFVCDAYTLDMKAGKNGTTRYASYKGNVPPALLLAHCERKYNEVLVRKWSVSAIFYTRGTRADIVQELVDLSDVLSFREYPNMARAFREKGDGPQKIIKAFPIYEIDLETKSWRVAHLPQRAGYAVRIDSKTNESAVEKLRSAA